MSMDWPTGRVVEDSSYPNTPGPIVDEWPDADDTDPMTPPNMWPDEDSPSSLAYPDMPGPGVAEWPTV